MQGIGKRIKEYRTEAGLTQEKLAEMVDISTNYLSAIEREVKVPKLETLIRIVNALNLSADDILQDVIHAGTRTRCSKLEKRMEGLPGREKERISRVIDVLIEEARK